MSLQKSTQLLAFAILIATVQATRFSFDRGLCQRLGNEALHGCPKSTLRVGPHAEFQHIQDAIDSISDRPDPFVILVEPGNYTEQLNITRAGSLWLLGVTDSPNDRTKNSVNVIWHNATGTATTGTYDNAYTSTLTIAPNFNASLTGTGPTGFDVPPDTPFGNIDFRTYNLNFINDYLPYAAGPSLALSISYANGGFYYTRFLSYQDTVYVGKLGNAYMYESEVAGQTDFFYGFGTCWITDSLVSLRGCGGGITAWKGTNTTFENKYGIYIHDSVVQKANSSLDIEGQCALGRPWNPQHRSIFANCYLDNSIRASGYIQWSTADPRVNQNTSMAEYRDFGPGYDAAGRVAASNVSIRLTKEQYAPFATVSEVFQFPSGGFGNTAWIDRHPRA